MTRTHALRLMLASAATLLLASCATTTQPTALDTDTSHAALKERAQARWDALIAHQAEKAYDYLTPGYSATISRDDYATQKNNPATRWIAAKVNKVSCASATKCDVYVIVTYQVHLPGMMAAGPAQGFAPIDEQWLQVRNKWYYLPRETGKSGL